MSVAKERTTLPLTFVRVFSWVRPCYEAVRLLHHVLVDSGEWERGGTYLVSLDGVHPSAWCGTSEPRSESVRYTTPGPQSYGPRAIEVGLKVG
jgi:hypothetical protein